MTDPKRPPPLPPRPIVAEPFPLADSDRPPPVNRTADTPRSGGTPDWSSPVERQLDNEVWSHQLALEQAHEQIRALQQALAQQPSNDTPLPLTRPSQRVRRAQMAKALGKWAALITLLPLVGGVVAKRWPEYSGIVDLVLQLVGLK